MNIWFKEFVEEKLPGEDFIDYCTEEISNNRKYNQEYLRNSAKRYGNSQNPE